MEVRTTDNVFEKCVQDILFDNSVIALDLRDGASTRGALRSMGSQSAIWNTLDELTVLHDVYLVDLHNAIQTAPSIEMIAGEHDDGIGVQVNLLVGRKLQVFDLHLLKFWCTTLLTELLTWANFAAN